MTWHEIARKDVADSIRSNTFVLLAVGFLLVTFTLSSMQQIFGDPTFEEGVGAAFGTMSLLIPIVAVLLSYPAIVGERESGSIHVLLSLPVSRAELLLGKTVGRTLALFVPVFIGYMLVIPFLYVIYGSFALSEYGQFLVGNLTNGILYTVIGVSVSAALATSRRVLAVLTGLFLTVYFALYVIGDVLYWAIHGEVSETSPAWIGFIENLAPHEAIGIIMDVLWTRELSTGEPLLLQEWVSVIVFALWFIVPVAIGYLRFRSSDVI
ncbi:copper ABC transporter permease (plasmid) [Natrialba magadii ATCC 43099]|uniref:Copper ABC transporter permease n=1 Tax=Natrialba magadii (strain ATCC 43099 / DSM 3394 / CCM 3739 / CIP 104546 / IAM 13178 / JCM 8861 / NBRC 102185 / NCIMB 2190 / MS3) TaxID=547559 RepID=D3T1Y8_NATMM|nr:ABC transporter permease subunit [Natrialba magadii]ADD07597.1 copper ABC transporter permease [Natrialba magadii ATCC 43099]ELY27072.1 copper ABC transporter permease [Natrialba magadii ATCC 43099]